MREKVTARFEDSLDICNLVSVHSSLATLLSLLFKKEQLLLFQHQMTHTVPSKDKQLERDLITEAVTDQHGRPRVGLGRDEVNKKLTEKAFSQLLEYKAKTSMDKKLLLGILEPAKHYEASQLPRHALDSSHIPGNQVSASSANLALDQSYAGIENAMNLSHDPGDIDPFARAKEMYYVEQKSNPRKQTHK